MRISSILLCASAGLIAASKPEKPRKLFTPKASAENPAAPVPPTPTPAEPVPPELQPFNPKGIALFYLGNRNSEIEPCGCVKNQLGGIQYEGFLYNQVPRDNELRMDVGGWTARMVTPEGSMKSGYALRAMGGELDFDAVNVSGIDAGLGKAFFEKLSKDHPETLKPLVSANLFFSGQTEKPAFPPYRIVERKSADGKAIKCAIVGVTSSDPSMLGTYVSGQTDPLKDYTAAKPAEAIKDLIPELRKKVDLLIILAYGTWPEMEELSQKFPEVDAIISSMATPDYNSKVQTIGNVKVFGQYSMLGKQVTRVDLVRGEDGKWSPSETPVILGVSPKILKANEALVQLIADYKHSTEAIYIPRPPTVALVYSGSQQCVACHQAEYNSWTHTRHFTAYQSLVQKGSQYDPS
ncbi:hypothetical protein HYR69_08750, partial [Candidatus Sumerlaeota bacterium]|nr:hypothetical protein [Candidatus Sumerlaeota bacterium]